MNFILFNSSPTKLICLFGIILFSSLIRSENQRIEILMPSVTTNEDDAYICTSFKLEDSQQYIYKIEPLTNAEISHHMFLYGCEYPSSSKNSWACGSNPCSGASNILFAWGLNAPSLQLPKGVAFKVGPKTQNKYMVINMHYLNKVNNDHSGLAITVGNIAPHFEAGIMLLYTGEIWIPAYAPKYQTRISCQYSGRTINVFAFRVHAHIHGDSNAAYRVRGDNWTELVHGDPQWPQAFYPTKELYNITKDDILVGICTYHNDENRTVRVGGTHRDEMCNVYLMYYTDFRDDVMSYCDGHFNKELEAQIPEEAGLVPANIYRTAPLEQKYALVNKWHSGPVLGQIGGVFVEQKTKTLTVFHRGKRIWDYSSFYANDIFNSNKYQEIPEETLISFNMNSGKVLKSYGANLFYMPHGLKIDNEGNIWVTDVGRHQVLKFNPENLKKPVLVVGEKLKPGNDKTHLCKPADIAVLSSGDFFVADGYCNTRIVKFNKNGEYLEEWWSNGDKTKPSSYIVVHSLALHEAENRLCVADRENFRIQCFDLSGKFLFETLLSDYGQIYAVAFAANNGSTLFTINIATSKSDTKVIRISTQTGKVMDSISLKSETHHMHSGSETELDIRHPHSLSVSDDSTEFYIGSLNPPEVYKFKLVNYDAERERSQSKGQQLLSQDSWWFKKLRSYRNFIIIVGSLISVLFFLVFASSIKEFLGQVRVCMCGNRHIKSSGGFIRIHDHSEEEVEHLNNNEIVDGQDGRAYNRAVFHDFSDNESISSDAETRNV